MAKTYKDGKYKVDFNSKEIKAQERMLAAIMDKFWVCFAEGELIPGTEEIYNALLIYKDVENRQKAFGYRLNQLKEYDKDLLNYLDIEETTNQSEVIDNDFN